MDREVVEQKLESLRCVDIGAHLISGMEVPPPDTMGQTFDLLAQSGFARVVALRCG